MAYATGIYALAICDRCGQQQRYLDMQKEWTGFLVCTECFEPKHPQLEPITTPSDPQALYQPRPARIEPYNIYVGVPPIEKLDQLPVIAVGVVGNVTVTTS